MAESAPGGNHNGRGGGGYSGGGGSSNLQKQGGSRLTETTAAELLEYESMNSEQQSVFQAGFALLQYNLQQIDADQRLTQTVATHIGDAVHLPAERVQLTNNLDSLGTVGRELRCIADSFRRSPEAAQVLNLANRVQLDTVSRDWFLQQLRELFAHGYNIEAFVTLFHFVACLLKRFCSERGFEEFSRISGNLLRWFLEFVLVELIKFLVDYTRTLSHTEWRSLAHGFAIGTVATAVVGMGFYLYFRK